MRIQVHDVGDFVALSVEAVQNEIVGRLEDVFVPVVVAGGEGSTASEHDGEGGQRYEKSSKEGLEMHF